MIIDGKKYIRVYITRNVLKPYIENVPFEETYLPRVIASEMSNGWPYQSLLAQAITSRSIAEYWMKVNAENRFDVWDTTKSQAYKKHDLNKIQNCVRAVNETKGVVLTYADKIAQTYFCGSNGGTQITCVENGWKYNLPYLIHQDDPWTRKSLYPKAGHSIGLSQRGAQWAANHGINYVDILEFYFPKTELENEYGKIQPTPKKLPLLCRGVDNRPYVRKLQAALQRNGYDVDITSYFDNLTFEAVVAFQQKMRNHNKKVVATGVVDSNFWLALIGTMYDNQ